ncbi:MAG: ATP-dependent Clp protease adaptor ClpS [Cyanobacteria bacterium SZAS LIN-3]|nr:ATP-dependent Clp protease adaptor ClpS [Cyanobacteria bacterium SZAS LIN-3]MBS2007819.1 ATP-dependent Clp protease adaptor ClpS [Cyanobacteria bacterium SZAS TMP-1]
MGEFDDENEESAGGGTAVVTEKKIKVERPPLFKVLLHNDDYTSMEFVTLILEQIFHKSPAEAHKIMMAVHQMGVGVAGVYPYEIAEAKVTKVTMLARQQEFPLRCSLEQE